MVAPIRRLDAGGHRVALVQVMGIARPTLSTGAPMTIAALVALALLWGGWWLARRAPRYMTYSEAKVRLRRIQGNT